ncbi:MAG TPA: hypothetical protein VL282_07155, partial [Tepidisphaeraceae bacterium]|nr:hypothetical protein [Tepidisphaeraceae bacterium]
LSSGNLIVKSGDASRAQQIQFPAKDQEANFFVDLPSIDAIVEARLDVKDDLPLDNVAWLVRRRTWPKIEPVDSLPPEVERMVEVYRKNRPADASSTSLLVTSEVRHLPANRPGVVLSTNATSARIDPAELKIVPHELTRDIDWKALAANASASTAPAGDWTPLVTAGDHVLLAVRESSRQAFIGIDPRSVSQSAQFVILWAKLFDWAGQGAALYATDRVHAIDPSWQLVTTNDAARRYDPPLPGVYRRTDGSLLAMSALDVKLPPAVPTDLSKLDRLAKDGMVWIDFRPAFLLAAIVSLLAAFILLKTPKRRAQTPQFADV